MRALGPDLSSASLTSAPRYRTVAEADILALMRLYGWAFEARRHDHPTLDHEISAALDRLVGEGLPFESLGEAGRRFDPVELINHVKYAGLHQGKTLWPARFVTTGRLLAREFGGPDCGPPNLADMPERSFRVTLARDFHLPHARVGSLVRLRLPLPLEDHSLDDLSVVPLPPAGLDMALTVTRGRLEACFAMPAQPMVTLAAALSFRARPRSAKITAAPLPAEEAELYTRPREALIVVSPRLRSLAASLSAGVEETGLDQAGAIVRRYWDFLRDRMNYGQIHYDRLASDAPLDDVLENGWYDCQLGAALFIALCRASHIPARLVGGYLLYPTAPSDHYWAEVWFDEQGWTPFDFGCWDLSAGGRDPAWRDYFYGQIDYRMKTQILPRQFTGTPNLRLPSGWHRLQRLEREGASISYCERESGRLLFRDCITVS